MKRINKSQEFFRAWRADRTFRKYHYHFLAAGFGVSGFWLNGLDLGLVLAATEEKLG